MFIHSKKKAWQETNELLEAFMNKHKNVLGNTFEKQIWFFDYVV